MLNYDEIKSIPLRWIETTLIAKKASWIIWPIQL